MAIFMNPKSAELELENLETTSSHRLLPFGTESAAEDGIRRDTTPSRTAHFKRNSATSSSRYENVAISVPSTPSLSPPSNTTELGTKQSERRNSSESSQMMRNLSIRASLRSTSNSARKQRKDDSSTNSFFAKLQLFYEHSPLRHFAPFLLLIAYALLGALLFFVLESENERQLLANEQRQLEVLRGQTIQKIEGNLKTTIRERWSKSKKIMLDFERDFMRLKVPEGTLEWNYLGALFYVGTVFTTIGYGNITPRTSPGQALSILYAIVGIPLVLAILNQTSKKMTKWLSEKWICYHKRIKAKRHKTRRGDERVMEEGNGGVRTADNEGTDKETMESRTIPVWMALSIVSGYMCTIAAIFLIWESRWSYFTSFYFICISCLTIGLGDVVPDHPQMLILMFVFVIFGLSFVSMLLSVIQIKMEEWLYKMMIQMQKEYQKALREVSDPIERDRIIAALYAREPWYMRQLAPLCVSETQKEKLENLTQSYEKVTKEANTRGTQTENWGEEEEKGETKQKHGTEQEENGGPKSMRVAKTDEEYISARAELSNSSRSLSRSISDATSLPMDPASISPRHLCSKEVQTELSGNIIEKMERDREREEKEKEEERIKEREREEKDKEEERIKEREREEKERIKEREREQKERERLKEKEKAPKTKTQSKAVDTGSDFVVSKEHRGTQLKAATSNKRTDTKGLIRTEDRAADTAQLIRKSVAKAVQTEEKRQQQRTVQTMFPSKEEEEEQSPMLKVDQRRRLFSLTGRKDEFEEEAEVTTDAWAQCSPPPELCDFGVQTLPLFGDFEVDETVEQLFEDDDEMSNDGSEQKEQRSESVAVTIGDEWLDMAYPKRTEKKDLVIQTDDSYLRIARRLDKLRTNRTDLNVYCTATNPPLRRKADGKRKSLRFLDPFRPRRRSKTPENEEKRAGEEADKCRVDAGTSPERPTPKRGRVAQLVATHEQSKPIQRDRAAPSPSAMASVAGRARKNIRHVRMAEDVRGNSDDEGEKAVGSR